MKYFQVLKKISFTAYLVAFITFLMKVGQFMSLPFLAIYLERAGILSSSQIGIVLGISGFMLSMTSLVNGMYIDRRSQKKTLILSLFLGSICYFGFAFSIRFFYGLLLLNAALGWFRSLSEISAVTLIVTHTERENLSYAYSARFMGANLGVALGPLIGALMAMHQSLMIFYIAGTINILIGVGLIFFREKPIVEKETEAKPNLLTHFHEIVKDKTLLIVTFINFILWTVYSMLDTTLPQYLANTWHSPARIFSTLMVLNAIICVVFQPFVLRWAQLSSLKLSGVVGSILFTLSFLLLGFHPTTILMIISVILMSFAELFTMPINSLLIMRVAPQHSIASYNGFFMMSLLGLSVGPILGGYGLQYIGGHTVFLIAACLPLIAIVYYLKHISD